MDGSETTVTEAIDGLRRRGFTHDFTVVPPGVVRCEGCGSVHAPETLDIAELIRIEGTSDPEDEAAVIGAVCSACGIRGVLVVAYGPSASAEEATVITGLGGHSDGGTTGPT